MEEIKGSEFIQKVINKEIEDGKKFRVYNKNNNTVIGRIGVIETTIVFLEFPITPNDLYSDNYSFVEAS